MDDPHPESPLLQQRDPRTHRAWTVPNALSAIRLIGSCLLPWLAVAEATSSFLVTFLFLTMTDWVDGKLAIALNQRSVLGARLDSWADAAMYAATLFGTLWLRGGVLQAESGWIALAVASYALTTAAGFWKFARWPSYHTRLAKISWLLAAVAVISVIGDWSIWPFRIATLAVTLTNVEALMITWTLTSWQADVPSLWHARGIARRDP